MGCQELDISINAGCTTDGTESLWHRQSLEVCLCFSVGQYKCLGSDVPLRCLHLRRRRLRQYPRTRTHLPSPELNLRLRAHSHFLSRYNAQHAPFCHQSSSTILPYGRAGSGRYALASAKIRRDPIVRREMMTQYGPALLARVIASTDCVFLLVWRHLR